MCIYFKWDIKTIYNIVIKNLIPPNPPLANTMTTKSGTFHLYGIWIHGGQRVNPHLLLRILVDCACTCICWLYHGLSHLPPFVNLSSENKWNVLLRWLYFETSSDTSVHIRQDIWVRSRNCGCLVTWFCYQLIAKPGNKTAAVSWPDPYPLLFVNSAVLKT